MKKIQILGAGCAKCEKLTELVKKAADSMNLEYELEKVKDIQKIVEFGVMITPALAVDGQIKFSGKVPSLEEIKKYLQ